MTEDEAKQLKKEVIIEIDRQRGQKIKALFAAIVSLLVIYWITGRSFENPLIHADSLGDYVFLSIIVWIHYICVKNIYFK